MRSRGEAQAGARRRRRPRRGGGRRRSGSGGRARRGRCGGSPWRRRACGRRRRRGAGASSQSGREAERWRRRRRCRGPRCRRRGCGRARPRRRRRRSTRCRRAPCSKSAAPAAKRCAGTSSGSARDLGVGRGGEEGQRAELGRGEDDGRRAALGAGGVELAEILGPEGADARARRGGGARARDRARRGSEPRGSRLMARATTASNAAGSSGRSEDGGGAPPRPMASMSAVDGPEVAEGERARGALVEDHAERVLVAAGVEARHALAHLLGGHVRRRPEHLARGRERQRRAESTPGCSTLEMPKSRSMERTPRRGCRARKMLSGLMSRWSTPASCAAATAESTGSSRSARRSTRERAVAIDDLGELLALEQVHRHEGDALDGPDVRDAHHVRVREARGRARLEHEALHHVEPQRQPGVEHLEGDALVQVDVPRLVDGGHAAGCRWPARSRSARRWPPGPAVCLKPGSRKRRSCARARARGAARAGAAGAPGRRWPRR